MVILKGGKVGREVRLGRLEVGDFEKMGKVEGWSGGKVGRLVVSFMGGRHRVSLRFHLFVFDINQGNKKT